MNNKPTSIEVEKAIHRALRHGAGPADIASLSGVSRTTIDRLKRSVSPGLNATVARKILEAVDLWVEFHPEDLGEPDVSMQRKEQLRDHVLELLDCGYDTVHLAELAGTDRYLIRDIRNGRLGRTVRGPIADRLEAIPASMREKIASPIGASRRIQSLVRWGYRPCDLAAELVLDDMELQDLLAGRTQSLDRGLAMGIAKLFSRLEQIPGPSDDARRAGKGNGWPLPLQYDEYTIDKATAAVAKEYRPMRSTVDPERRQQTWEREVEQLAEALNNQLAAA